jgi:metal-responsive CopG/Arc/MetJ family transcriptional regulator
MLNCKSAGLSLPKELLNWIDADRGDVSRSRYLLRMIERAYKENQNKKAVQI